MGPRSGEHCHAEEALDCIRRAKSVPNGELQGDRRCFSRAVIALHDKPDDCWLIIGGKVYDVTSWVPKHPGGSLIYVNAGRECTQLFESYHPLYVSKMLAKFEIGVAEPERGSAHEGSEPLVYACDGSDASFYTTLKQRVEAYFKRNKLNPRIHASMFVKAVVILASYFLFYYGAFFAFQSPWLALLCALGLGVMTAEVGVAIQHDCNHGAYSEWRGLAYVLGVSLDLVGASSFMWRQQHVVGHHLTTNVDHFDPDIRVRDPDVRRVTSAQPRQWYHAYQHVYLALLYGLLSAKSVFIDDFSAYLSGSIGPVKLARMTHLEVGIFLGGKLLYGFYMLLLPTLYGTHRASTFVLLYLASQLVAGWTLALLFQVAHVQQEAQFPTADRSSGVARVNLGWAAAQVSTTTDFSHGSLFWTHFSGGLNYQIEHHLFPGVCHAHYPRIQPIVEATCKEFDIPYHSYPTFWSALKAHFTYLQKVGLAGLELRLDG
eukprot:jgi/Mesen1/4559/ME000232S03817